ncbi:MAG TPA: prepilin-type N-terminal cleavage/methylation domain-containing protein [Pyrinomonadaceae bacterium]|jgi:Tfp pilus assembly protein FimT
MTRKKNYEKFRKQKGFGLPELLIIIFVISIIGVLALPRIISSRRLSQFAEMQKQIVVSLNEARQEAVTQGTPLTFRYDNLNKIIVIYNGSYGALGDARNRVIDFSSFGLEKTEIVYGRAYGTSETPLTDTSNLTNLTENSIEINFNKDGSVLDESNAPRNNALFFYHKKYPKDTAFAVSVLGDKGQVKAWTYSKNIKDYVKKNNEL